MESLNPDLRKSLNLLEQARTEIAQYNPQITVDTFMKNIWTAYSKVEMTIAILKMVNEEFSLGKFRSVKFSRKTDPSVMLPSKLQNELKAITSKIIECQTGIESNKIELAVESARLARDELKVLIGSYKKSNIQTGQKER